MTLPDAPDAQTLGFAFSTLISLCVAAWCGWTVLQALVTGTLRNSRGQAVSVRREAPLKFWAHVALDAALGSLVLGLWWGKWFG